MCFSGLVRTTLAALGFLAIGSAAHAGAIISGTYYEENASNSCSGSVNCSVLFSAIPTGKAVLLVRIACSIRVTTSVQIFRVELGLSRPSQPPTRFQDLTFVNTGSASALQKFYVVESDPHFLIGAGARPFVRLNTNSNALINMDCHIAGEI
jgi:hypothetical protein